MLALGFIGSGLLSSLGFAQAAWGLPEEDVLRQLATVPVFIMTDAQGAYLTNRLVNESPAEGDKYKEVALLYVFFSGQDAEQFLALGREQDPAFVEGVGVGWVELSALYQQAQVEREVPLRLLFVPETDELTAATEVNSEFASGVPLFAPKYRDEGSYALLPITNVNNGEPILPIFFSRSDLESVLDSLEEANPAMRARIDIDVLSLESLIQQFENEDDEQLNLIRLFPDSNAINYIRTSEANQPQRPPQNGSSGSSTQSRPRPR
jgi:nickel transport protein